MQLASTQRCTTPDGHKNTSEKATWEDVVTLDALSESMGISKLAIHIQTYVSVGGGYIMLYSVLRLILTKTLSHWVPCRF